MSLTVFSSGGGVQSTAALVMAAQGELACDAFLFANVGDDSENPATLHYMRGVARRYAKTHGISLIELYRQRRDGTRETLYERVMSGKRGLVIPVRASSGGPMRRQCTGDFKIAVVNRWLRQHGATAKNPATVMLGISLDEWRRMRTGGDLRYVRREYPLIDRRITRQDCINIITRAGLPIPPKSSCFFCPFHTLNAWREQRDHEPELFAKSVAMEQRLSDWSLKRGQRPVYMTDRLKPLPMVVGAGVQPSLFDDDACESGYCMV